MTRRRRRHLKEHDGAEESEGAGHAEGAQQRGEELGGGELLGGGGGAADAGGVGADGGGEGLGDQQLDDGLEADGARRVDQGDRSHRHPPVLTGLPGGGEVY